jgi:hypothetical protein
MADCPSNDGGRAWHALYLSSLILGATNPLFLLDGVSPGLTRETIVSKRALDFHVITV